jgi:hypothetical protein
MESILALAGLHPEGERETGFRLECGGGRIGVEACGDRLTPDGGIAARSHYLERVGMVEELPGLLLVGVGHKAEGERVSREDAKARRVLHRELKENLLLLLRCFVASREIPDPISRRWISNKPSSVICVGTTRSAHKNWLDDPSP